MIDWKQYKKMIQSYHCKACYEPLISLKLIIEDDLIEKNIDLVKDFLSNQKKSIYQIIHCDCCDILIHSKCRGAEEVINNKVIDIQFSENQIYPLNIGVITCAGCQYKERKKKEARCFECYNEGGYLTGLVNDNTRDRMVHPICAMFNRRFHIQSSSNLGFSLTNKYQRETIQDQKCFKCDKKINYKYKCPDEDCLVYLHYYCLMEERTKQIVADDDKYSQFLWNFSYSFSSEHFKLKSQIPTIDISEPEQLFKEELDSQSIEIQINQKVQKFENQYQSQPQIFFRCNQHPIIGRQQCICQQPIDNTSVICDYCSLWFHSKCLNIDTSSDSGFVCGKCQMLIDLNDNNNEENIINNLENKINFIYEIYNKYEFSLFDMLRLADFFFKYINQKEQPLIMKNGCFFLVVLDQFNWTKGLFQQFLRMNHQYLKTKKVRQFMLEKFMQCIQQKQQTVYIQNNKQKIIDEIKQQIKKYFDILEIISSQQRDNTHFLFEIKNEKFYLEFKDILTNIIQQNQTLSSFYKNILQLKKICQNEQLIKEINKCIQDINDVTQNVELNQSINPLKFSELTNIFQIIFYFLLQQLVQKNYLKKVDLIKSQGIYDQNIKQNFFRDAIKILSVKEIEKQNTTNFYYYFSLYVNNKMRFKEDVDQFLIQYRALQNQDFYKKVNIHNLPTKEIFLKDSEEYIIQEIKGNSNLSIQQIEKFHKLNNQGTKNKKIIQKFINQKKKQEQTIKKQLQQYLKSKNEKAIQIEEQIKKQIENLKVKSSISSIAEILIEINNIWQDNNKQVILNLLLSLGREINLQDQQQRFDFSKYHLKNNIIQFIENKQEIQKDEHFYQYYCLQNVKDLLLNLEQNLQIKKSLCTFIQFKKIQFLSKIKQYLFMNNKVDISIFNLNKYHNNILEILNFKLNLSSIQDNHLQNINNLCIIAKFYIEFYYNNSQPKEQLSLNLALYLKNIIEKILYLENYDQNSKIILVYQSLKLFIQSTDQSYKIKKQLFHTYEELAKYPQVNELKNAIQNKILNYKIFDNFKNQLEKQIKQSQEFFKDLRFTYEKFCQDQDINQQNYPEEQQYIKIKDQLYDVQCINPQTIYLFLTIQKYFIYQMITQKKFITKQNLQRFNKLYQDKKILPQLNYQIQQFFQKVKYLEQINNDLNIKSIYNIKQILDNNIFNGYIHQSKYLKFYKNITRLCFDENNKIKLEDYKNRIYNVNEKSKELGVRFSKDLQQLLNQPIDFYSKLQGNILTYNNEKRYLSQIIIKFIDEGKIKNIKYLEKFLEEQKIIYNKILEAQRSENLSYIKFNQELEQISYVPDLLQIAFIIFHIQNVLSRVLYNNDRENFITLIDLKKYYNSFIKISNDLQSYDFFKSYQEDRIRILDTFKKSSQDYSTYNINNIINKFYLQFLLIFIECEKYERKDIEDLKYLIKPKDKQIKFQIDDQKQLSHIGIGINKKIFRQIFQELQLDYYIENDFRKFENQVKKIYQQFQEYHKLAFTNFKQFVRQKNQIEVNKEIKKINNYKNLNTPEEYYKICEINFLKIKNSILKVQKKVTANTDRNLIERLEQAIISNRISMYSKTNKSIQLKSFLRILKDNIDKEENFNNKAALKLIQYFKETTQINELINNLISFKTNVKLILQSCNDYFKNKQKEIPKKNNLVTKFHEKKKIKMPNIFTQKKIKKNSFLDDLLKKNKPIEQKKPQSNIQSLPSQNKKQNISTFLQQQQESDNDSLQELKFKKKKQVKKSNYIYTYIDNPFNIQIKKKNGIEVDLSIELYTGQSKKFIQDYPKELLKNLQLRHSPVNDQFIEFLNKKLKNPNSCFVFYTMIKNEEFWDTYRENDVLNFYVKSNNYKIILTNFRFFLEQEISCFRYLSFLIKEDILQKIGDLKNLFFLILIKPKEDFENQQPIELIKDNEQPLNINRVKQIIKQKLEKNPLYDKEVFLKQFNENQKPIYTNNFINKKIDKGLKQGSTQSINQSIAQNQQFNYGSLQQNNNLGYQQQNINNPTLQQQQMQYGQYRKFQQLQQPQPPKLPQQLQQQNLIDPPQPPQPPLHPQPPQPPQYYNNNLNQFQRQGQQNQNNYNIQQRNYYRPPPPPQGNQRQN